MRHFKTGRWLTVAALPFAALAFTASIAGASVLPRTTLPVPSHVHIRLSATALITGQPLTASAGVAPRTPPRIVTFQRQTTHHWRNIAQAVTDSTGKVTVNLKLTVPGTYKIRASVALTATAGAAVSPTDVVVISPVPPPYAGATLSPGSTGAQVVALQDRLSSLGYWLGTNGGFFGDATEQAVYAFQKAANLTPTGVVGPTTVAALQAGDLPQTRSKSGYVIEINLKKDLVMFVNNGTVEHVLNTSTGGGYTYVENGQTDTAITPTGVFHIFSAVNGIVKNTLGILWRPRFFYEGFAIHGDSYVPPIPVSHGCARVSNEAINWIWASNLAPIGTEVWVYG
jgi:peptidoglycan hydrolase-like protein with peptidoglycan-binding domain